MGFDQKGKSVFCVVQGESGKWHVSEEGFEKPIASFESRNDAEKYANDLAATKEGSTVKMPEQMRQQASRMQDQGAGNRS